MKYKTIRDTLEHIESYANYHGNRIILIDKDNTSKNPNMYVALIELKEEKNEDNS